MTRTEPLPPWLRKNLSHGHGARDTGTFLKDLGLHTICESGRCPNRNECWSHGTATFMIMGDRCTRHCRYCAVSPGRPQGLDPHEPAKVAEAVGRLALTHVVVTSVTRDDLEDGGVGHFARVVLELKRTNPALIVETLTPDFKRNQDEAVSVLKNLPIDIFNHNIETVERLHPRARPQGGYRLSLAILKKMREAYPSVMVKSGAMLGLGETADEVRDMLRDLKAHGCQMITLGQYLKSFSGALEVERFVPPGEFEEYREIGYNMGFLLVESGPFVRSSYHAKDSFEKLRRLLMENSAPQCESETPCMKPTD